MDTKWPYFRKEWHEAQTIDLPVLSTKERLELQRSMNTGEEPTLDYSLPVGRLLKKPKQMVESFGRYYRMTPAFAKVDL